MNGITWYLEMNIGGVVHSDEEIERVKKLLDSYNESERREII